ncbi:hypothetical protein GQ43DRAFT_103083 [Delitschia confertaspora ATCC 74209]|uniref:Uncharacterized protein n=1 Tax=Delitschia confertaspora ATCC 74209 TaxID=1513339 RepID=A0A9P4JXB9_9PLEO|nr:hypothetical protein GQ43DRAFT_103083 [Delitschia confertaspora ATCC 74209]
MSFDLTLPHLVFLFPKPTSKEVEQAKPHLCINSLSRFTLGLRFKHCTCRFTSVPLHKRVCGYCPSRSPCSRHSSLRILEQLKQALAISQPRLSNCIFNQVFGSHPMNQAGQSCLYHLVTSLGIQISIDHVTSRDRGRCLDIATRKTVAM